MKASVRRILEAAGGVPEGYSGNEWGGADLRLPGGGTVRLTSEGGEGEPVEMLRFDDRMMLEWQASFSSGTPAGVVAAAWNEAQRVGGKTD